jgi:biofilm PGA synthesis N-glycosyltransferase PgaC
VEVTRVTEKSKAPKVFLDQRGLRWIRVKAILFLAILGIGIGVAWVTPLMVNSANSSGLACCEKQASINYPKDLAYSEEIINAPIFGEGYLQRVVRIENGVVLNAVTGEKIRMATPQESEIVNFKGYAIEKYGAVEGRYLSLSFDDGPDPLYTPKILDILAREKIQATFFVTGENATKYPELIKRMAREGHVVANHTFTHIDFDTKTSLRDRMEILGTDKVIRNLTGHTSTYFRLPYSGNDEASIKQNLRGILQAQQLGFEVSAFTLDTDDWKMVKGNNEIAPLDEKGNIVLMHDSGGNRAPTIDYLEGLVAKGKAEGFRFLTMSQLQPNPGNIWQEQAPNFADKFTYWLSQLIYVFPNTLLGVLFGIAAVNILLFNLINALLAILNRHRLRKKRATHPQGYHPRVTVLIAAYNEELVIEKTIKSFFRSKYRNMEIIVVDDGSIDNTSQVLYRLEQRYKRLKVIAQENAGKAEALNRGIKAATGEIILTADADTVFLPDTIGNLVWHFIDPSIGAVAGFVKVGNGGNLLTRWQALEYISGITFERFSHSFFGMIMITPGACGAWRKTAILKGDGFESDTLAEDCDLTLKIQRLGYKAITDLDAIAYTEAPKTVRDLLKQRFRWMYGNMQAFWKQRRMIMNPKYGFLGMFILPQAIFALLVQMVFMPFTYLMMVENLLAGEYQLLLIYLLSLTVLQFFISLFAIWVSRESYKHLAIVPVYRLIAEPLRAYLLYSSLLSILKGRLIEWNKVERHGEVKEQPEDEKVPVTANA